MAVLMYGLTIDTGMIYAGNNSSGPSWMLIHVQYTIKLKLLVHFLINYFGLRELPH